MTVPEGSEVVYVGCTAPARDVLETLIERGVPIVEIVTIDPETARKHGVSGYVSFAEIGDRHDVLVYYPETYSMTDADCAHVRDVDPDLLIVNGWQRLIPEEALEAATYGALGNRERVRASEGAGPVAAELVADRGPGSILAVGDRTRSRG